MSSRARLNEMRILGIAEEIGLDTDALQAERKNPEIAAIINRNKLLADSLGVTGTPAFVIGDTLVPGAASLAQLKALVERARQGS